MLQKAAQAYLTYPVRDVSTQIQVWARAFDLWITSRRSENTKRAYRKSWDLFLDFTNKLPWDITKADILVWISHLQEANLSKETIQQRLAALSSFYTYANRTYTWLDANHQEHSLHGYNPVQAIPRPRPSPYDKAHYLSTAEARALLRAVPRNTIYGLRDYALLLAYLLTGRRNSEIRMLRYGDIEHDGKTVWYRWQGKGKARRDECPGPVWDSIVEFLRAAGKLETITPMEFIFTPLSDAAANLPNVDRQRWDRSQPLSARETGRLLKRYARRAGLAPERVHIHTLRHTAAMLRKEAGEHVEDISRFLAHSNLATTQIYLHRVEGRQDSTWGKVEALLGLGNHDQVEHSGDGNPSSPIRYPVAGEGLRRARKT